MIHVLVILICFGAVASYHYFDATPNPELDKIAETIMEEEASHLLSNGNSNVKKD